MSSKAAKIGVSPRTETARTAYFCISKKPGSCVSLLPAKRGRTRRGPKPRPCCGAAHLHVSFHDKHFHRWSRTLFYLFLRLPGSCLHWGGHGAEVEGKEYWRRTSYMCDNFIASVVIRLLSIQISSKRLQTHCGCLFRRFSRRPVFWHDPICPRSVLIFDGCFLCFILRRAFSLPCPSLLLLKCVISPSHHQQTPKTAHRHFSKSKKKSQTRLRQSFYEKAITKNARILRKENVTKTW